MNPVKNIKVSVKFYQGYTLSLQLTNVTTDSAGNVTTGIAWTNLCDPLKSFHEYGNGKWTQDTVTMNKDAFYAVIKMIDVVNDYNGGVYADEDTAKDAFKAAFNEWQKQHMTIVSSFVARQIVGLNTVATVATVVNNVVNFFKDVPNFQVSARFINTLALQIKAGGRDAAIQYVKGYFDLQGMTEVAYEMIAKMGLKTSVSPEWDEIESGIYALNISTVVNKRLKLYYGPKGTGKTTQALSELVDPSDVIVCNSAMDSNDLVFDFDFDKDGKPTFKPGRFIDCAEAGRPIVLDELNLLNDDVLRFLQGVTDNKEEFTVKGHTFKIKPGFFVIGTMNLTVNGNVFPLPDPLVDRALEIREFNSDSSMLEACLM